ncbi:MAG TPA: hypothetical protein VM785_01725 [Gaiellales bacterium]|jgi:hypothetical protein|nr:hypothetical protein [Gaiellales bacterium]
MTEIDDLVERVLEDWRAELSSGAIGGLHARPTREVADAGLTQLASEDPDRRRVGCLILRELTDSTESSQARPRAL